MCSEEGSARAAPPATLCFRTDTLCCRTETLCCQTTKFGALAIAAAITDELEILPLRETTANAAIYIIGLRKTPSRSASRNGTRTGTGPCARASTPPKPPCSCGRVRLDEAVLRRHPRRLPAAEKNAAEHIRTGKETR